MNWNLEVLNTFFGETNWDYSAGFSEEDVDDFLESMWYEGLPDYDYQIGATKLVIIPCNTTFVIKIPYNEAIHFGECFDLIGLPKGFNDYCQYELALYEIAEVEGWEEFFLPIEYIGEYKGIPIYIQEKAEEYLYCPIDYSSEDSRKAVENKRKEDRYYLPLSLPFDWIACCLDILKSMEKVREFFRFLENTKISRDLHKANIGYFKNKPVIIDYGGYFEEV